MTAKPANTAAMLNIAVLISGGGSTLANLIESSGLVSVEIYPYGGGSDVLIDMGNKIFKDHKFLLAVHKIGWKFLKIIGIAQKIKKAKMQKFPLGYVAVAKKV